MNCQCQCTSILSSQCNNCTFLFYSCITSKLSKKLFPCLVLKPKMFETRLFVGNLPNSVQEIDLRSAFSSYGEVTNLDIKSKSVIENDPKKFAFVTISSANSSVESCIKYFSSNDYEGSRLYVTRARESFLERLQRERQQVEKKETDKKDNKESSKKQPIIKLGEKLNPKKRKVDTIQNGVQTERNLKIKKIFERNPKLDIPPDDGITQSKNVSATDKQKQEADKKRMESMYLKRQEFKNKQQIIKTGLIGIDKVSNKKLRFSDNEDDEPHIHNKSKSSKIERQDKMTTLFDDEDSDGGVNFEIKKHYEGKKGQKVLDLQSRYKFDKRFVLDERFIEDEHSEDNEGETEEGPGEQIDVTQGDEKSKQIKILEDVLGVSIKSLSSKPEKDRKTKPNMGMIRFDPLNPEHAKFVVPIEEVKPETKKSKKSKTKEIPEPLQPAPEVPKIEVSKEQFYKSEITKDAFEQPATGFSLRNLFARENDDDFSKDQEQQDKNYIPLQPQKQQKVKNPMDPGEKNPFVYDSSESEGEEDDGAKMNVDSQNALPEVAEVKAVWKEKLFFSKDDIRLRDGLAFFTKMPSRDVPKERRELKSVMMKRIHNTERKNQMFRKKIGGRKKSMKKSYKRKS